MLSGEEGERAGFFSWRGGSMAGWWEAAKKEFNGRREEMTCFCDTHYTWLRS